VVWTRNSGRTNRLTSSGGAAAAQEPLHRRPGDLSEPDLEREQRDDHERGRADVGHPLAGHADHGSGIPPGEHQAHQAEQARRQQRQVQPPRGVDEPPVEEPGLVGQAPHGGHVDPSRGRTGTAARRPPSRSRPTTPVPARRTGGAARRSPAPGDQHHVHAEEHSGLITSSTTPRIQRRSNANPITTQLPIHR
jgi:hypothetical protein